MVNKSILFLVIFLCIFSVQAVSLYGNNRSCYQETANRSSSWDGNCDPIYNGSYSASYSGDYSDPPIDSNNGCIYSDYKIFDGNWEWPSVGAIPLASPGCPNPNDFGIFYVNYSFDNRVYGAKWSVKVNTTEINNITIPNQCLQNYTLELKWIANAYYLPDFTPWGYPNHTMQCYNHSSNSFINISYSSDVPITLDGVEYSLPYMFEEGITWNMSEFSINSQSYNNITYETSIETFSLNFSTSNKVSVNSIFNYNNTVYPSTVTCYGSSCLASSSIQIPSIVSGTQENRTFYWTIMTYNGTSNLIINSSLKNQTVNQIGLSKCDTGTIFLNFSNYDEQNLTRQMFQFDADFEYSTSFNGVTKKFSVYNASAKELYLCGNTNITYYLNAIIAYLPVPSSAYTIRNYFYQNYPINNVTNNVNLNSLLTGYSTQFILQVQDSSTQPVKGVLVNAQRCYPGLNNNETAFISRTDSSGLTTGNLEANNALYQFFITNSSRTLLAVTPCNPVTPQTVPYTLLFQLGGSTQIPFINIGNVTDVTSSLNYNNQNNIFTWTYVDTSSDFVSSNLVIRSLNYTGNTQPTVCTANSTLSTAVLTCNISTAGTYVADVYITRDGEKLIDQTIFVVNTIASTMGYYGAFLGFFIILISAFMFKWNEIAGIWSVVVAVIFCNMIGFIDFGYVFITGLLCVSVIITAVLER